MSAVKSCLASCLITVCVEHGLWCWGGGARGPIANESHAKDYVLQCEAIARESMEFYGCITVYEDKMTVEESIRSAVQ